MMTINNKITEQLNSINCSGSHLFNGLLKNMSKIIVE